MLQLLQSLHVRGLEPAVLGFPLVLGRGTDAVLPPQLVDWAPGIGFFQDRHDLRFGELRLAHGTLLARMTIVPENSPHGCLDLGGAYATTAA